MMQMLHLTPTWVFFLFFFLVYMGYLQSKTREVSKMRIAILPVAMIVLSLYSVWAAFGASALGFSAWTIAAALALLVNATTLQQPRGVSYNPANGRFVVPGSWVPFGLMMAIFVAKYFVNAVLAMHTLSPDIPAFIGIASFAFGLLSGTFFARALHIGKTGKPQATALVAG